MREQLLTTHEQIAIAPWKICIVMVECKLFDRDNRTSIPNKAGPAKPLSQKIASCWGAHQRIRDCSKKVVVGAVWSKRFSAARLNCIGPKPLRWTEAAHSGCAAALQDRFVRRQRLAFSFRDARSRANQGVMTWAQSGDAFEISGKKRESLTLSSSRNRKQ
jgi:hypothetical protein